MRRTCWKNRLLNWCARCSAIRRFPVTANLLLAGLTSLSAVRLASMLNERFGYSPDVKRLLKGLSVLEIEDELIARMLGAVRPDSPASVSLRRDRYPLTQTQTGIYLECERSGESDIYNIPLLLRVSSAVDANRLADAVHAAVEAHPALKCSIEADAQGNLFMLPHDDLPWGGGGLGDFRESAFGAPGRRPDHGLRAGQSAAVRVSYL